MLPHEKDVCLCLARDRQISEVRINPNQYLRETITGRLKMHTAFLLLVEEVILSSFQHFVVYIQGSTQLHCSFIVVAKVSIRHQL